MKTKKYSLKLNKLNQFAVGLFVAALIFSGCQSGNLKSPLGNAPKTLRDVPALRLNFRFETDVPAPNVTATIQNEERNVAVSQDFDNNRASESLDKTLTSPDKQRVLAIYHLPTDLPSEFRLDMYSADGKLLRKITYDGMAAHFIDTIVWSPDSKAVAFVAMVRANQSAAPNANQANANQSNANTETAANTNAENANVEANANTDAETNVNAAPANTPTVEAAKPVLTFRTEQLYVCDREGVDVKSLTQNEGMIYFYFVWSPDSTMLAALAATYQEWNYFQAQSDMKGEIFTPQGRPRVVEKSGRERRLDDNLTPVRPVWSPDSAKVAVALGGADRDKQVRIYDAIGNQPTQAAIPLRNQLLISSKTYDENLQRQEQGDNQNVAATPTNQQTATLPDENSLVSFNPIISLEWTTDDMLYLQTGYIKQMKNEADSARSYLRWHRLVFSPQANTATN